MSINFEIVKHNFLGYFKPEDCSVKKFRPWIRFLNEHPIFKNSICLNAPLKITPLFLMCSTAQVSSESNSFIFTVEGTPYLVDENSFQNCPEFSN